MKHPSISETTRKIIKLVLAATLLLVSITANSQTYTVLYKFQNNGIDPQYPTWTGLFAQGRDGNLYSTSQSGGKDDYGTVFQLSPAGKMKVLHSFTNAVDDGSHPASGLTLGTDGSLYGTTTGGGTTNGGRVFKITTRGAFKVLHSFDGGTEGSQPKAPPIQGTDGNFYGTTFYGKGGRSGSGMVYKMTPQGKLTVLYQFDFTHGGGPIGLIQGTDGDFYGTAEVGGTGKLGVVFKVTSRGKLTVLYNFDGTKGQYPIGPIIQASDGNFYGTTQLGGTDGYGVIYKMTPSGTLTTIFNFLVKDQGYAKPLAGLVQATDGNLYGATALGGTFGHGQLFQITPEGKYTVLHNMLHNTAAGSAPDVSLFQHTNGTLYSDTYEGGDPACVAGCGLLYSLGMGLGNFVSFVGPLFSGAVGETIEILGQGLTGTIKVSFHGLPATFTVVSDTYLTAVVPAGATSGSVIVKTPSGTLTSNKVFRVTPAILSFNPTNGPVGTPVTITGTSFTGATKVTFGGVKATTFSVDSDTQITANVPTGAKTGKIAVTTLGGTATSKDVFTVTQ